MATTNLAHASAWDGASPWSADADTLPRGARPRLVSVTSVRMHAVRAAARQVGALAGAGALTVTALVVVGSVVGTLSR